MDLNIQGKTDVVDPFYRYKMPKMILVKQRNKYCVDNFDEVCKSLHRDPAIVKDFMKRKLGVNLQYKDGKIYTTAPLDYEAYLDILKDFIDDYVLCDNCDLPETVAIVKNKKIKLFCDCCSHVVVKSLT